VNHDSQQLLKTLIRLHSLLIHGKDHQTEILISVLQEFEIARKIDYCIEDNHDSNDRLCHAISLFLQEKKIKWNPAHYQIHCNDHILNLAVQVFLFDVKNAGEDEAIEEIIKSREKKSWWWMSSLEKLHNIVIHIHATSVWITEFKKLADRELSCDNDTRWNSWYLLLKVAIEKKSAVDAYTKRWIESLRENFLTSENWKSLHETAAFLKSFYHAIKKTEDDYVAIDWVLWTMNILIKHYDRSLVSFLYK